MKNLFKFVLATALLFTSFVACKSKGTDHSDEPTLVRAAQSIRNDLTARFQAQQEVQQEEPANTKAPGEKSTVVEHNK